MGMPELVIASVLVEGRTKTEVARDYGVSRRWVITLVQRFLAEGEAGLVPRSRRPRTSPHRTSQRLEEEIIETGRRHAHRRIRHPRRDPASAMLGNGRVVNWGDGASAQPTVHR